MTPERGGLETGVRLGMLFASLELRSLFGMHHNVQVKGTTSVNFLGELHFLFGISSGAKIIGAIFQRSTRPLGGLTRWDLAVDLIQRDPLHDSDALSSLLE